MNRSSNPSLLSSPASMLPSPFPLGLSRPSSSSLLFKPPRTHPKLSVMIRDAILSGKKKAGMSPLRIALAIEAKYGDQLPPNFRKILFLKLRKLAVTGRLIKNKAKFFPKPNFLKHPNVIPRMVQAPSHSSPLGVSPGIPRRVDPFRTTTISPYEVSLPALIIPRRQAQRRRGRAKKGGRRSTSKSKTRKTKKTTKRRSRSRSAAGSGRKRSQSRPRKKTRSTRGGTRKTNK